MQHRAASLLAAVFFLLAAMYSLTVPLFEAPDETYHYPVIQHIASTGRLPVQQIGQETLWQQEGSQPPLYYLAASALTFWIDTSDLPDIRWLNPHSKIGLPYDPDNKNLVIHTDAEWFPWRGTVLAMRITRMFSVGLGTITVVLVYQIALTLWPSRQQVALLAAAFTAFNPQFLFISGAINNDNLLICLSTWTILLAVRMVKSGLTAPRIWATAVALALASLTKVSGLILFPVAGLALLFNAFRTRRWRTVMVAVIAIGATWIVLAGWWYARNLALYGELLGLQTMVAIAGPRDNVTLSRLRQEWYGFWTGYWAQFGWVSILTDRVIYRIYALLSWLALAGLVLKTARDLKRRGGQDFLLTGLLGFQVVMTFAGLVRWTLMTYGSLGRLMFPAIGAASILLATGLLSLVPERWNKISAAGIGGVLLSIAFIAPYRYIIPAYALPPEAPALPANVQPVGVVYDGLEIVGMTAQQEDPTGRSLAVTLYLRAVEPVAQNYSLYLRVLADTGEQLGRIDSYPGGGALPSSRMETGRLYVDRYLIHLSSSAPEGLRLVVGVANWQPPQYILLNGTLPNGDPVTGITLELED